MAMTNRERVGKALEILNRGLSLFVEEELKSQYGDSWLEEAKKYSRREEEGVKLVNGVPQWDINADVE
ncbi:MAG: hypothetical protein C4527_25310 [Candidatus Omnitrophota bacterium]|jgi:hypothetical protein|nr:MAG: hypothetical protein C4527_25310 [Candidatus Omnitrophota bacterium]